MGFSFSFFFASIQAGRTHGTAKPQKGGKIIFSWDDSFLPVPSSPQSITNMATIVHKLSTLHSLGQGLLVQLYNVRTFMSDPRIRPEFASPQHVKLAKNLVSKFPDPAPSDKVRTPCCALAVG